MENINFKGKIYPLTELSDYERACILVSHRNPNSFGRRGDKIISLNGDEFLIKNDRLVSYN